MVDVAKPDGKSAASSSAQKVPDLRGEIRALVPKLGLRNYWYPAVAKKRIPKRHPVQVRMLGEEICLYRGSHGQAVAVRDICPHRGARLSEGTCHWKGTVSCPYHGWTFDESGKNVAVLSEGPDSKICGKPGTEAKLFPTQMLKGIVFVWIGDEEPAPIQEDVPEEFFDPKTYLQYTDHTYWPVNWALALENYFDAHVSYLHRDDFQTLLSSPGFRARANAKATTPAYTGNGFTFAGKRDWSTPPQDSYSDGWKWPKHRFRRWWAWIFAPLFSVTRVAAPAVKDRWLWGPDLHLPGMARVGRENMPGEGRFRFGGGGFVGRMTRQVIAVEPDLTRLWYFHFSKPSNPLQRLWYKLLYTTFYGWANENNFSQQDGRVMFNLLWDEQEMLSGTDFGVVQWRKLVVTKHFGGRHAQFGSDPVAAQENDGEQHPLSIETPSN